MRQSIHGQTSPAKPKIKVSVLPGLVVYCALNHFMPLWIFAFLDEFPRGVKKKVAYGKNFLDIYFLSHYKPLP